MGANSKDMRLMVTNGCQQREIEDGDTLKDMEAGSKFRTVLDTVIAALIGGASAVKTALDALRPATIPMAAQVFTFTNLLAKVANGVVAATAGTAANALVLVDPMTALAGGARNIVATFGAGWDGGTVTVTGTGQFDEVVSEQFVGVVGGNTVTGTKLFKTVTSAVKSAVGINAATVTIGTGDKVGLNKRLVDAVGGVLLCDGTIEAATLDKGAVSQSTNGFTPTTAPNGAHDYVLIAHV